jgi:3-hydroxybutyryl-CoA dehydrogenase
MKNILVIGAGFMGAGIAQVCAQSGYQVVLSDSSAEALEKATAGLKWSVEKLKSKGLLAEEPDQVLARFKTAGDLSWAAEADLVIEAVYEKEELKHRIFRELGALTGPRTILATNTSTIPITRIAAVTTNPERVLGLHFFGPVPFMALVEVIQAEQTSPEVFEQGVAFIKSLGKMPVRVRMDIPGFVMNRIFAAAFSEALDLVAKGVVTAEEADLGMRLGYGWNIGPFEIADNAGLDTFVLVGKSMQALGETRLAPGWTMLEEMVAQGRLGRKTGHGFYRYTADGKKLPGGAKI